MGPTNSELFNSKLIRRSIQTIEESGPNALGSNPVRSSSVESTPLISTLPDLGLPKTALPTSAPTILPERKLIHVASQPIPLRTLITLLNYERLTRDRRYENLSLYHSSEMESRKIEESDTVYTEAARCFCYDDSPYPPDQEIWRQSTCRIHPEAPPETRRLNSTQLERAFYESRCSQWASGCELMYQLFFRFCGEGQQLKIQISNEQPVLVNASDMHVMRFVLIRPKHRNLNGEHQRPDSAFKKLMLGRCKGVILVFFPPGEDTNSLVNGSNPRTPFDDCFVVDMLHMRYGKKGLFEEPYFLGNGGQWKDFMYTNVCAGIVQPVLERPCLTKKRAQQREEVWNWFFERSLRAIHRWTANDQNSKFLWCDYCGIGGAKFIICCGEGEREEITRYCSEEHRQRGWPLHRFTCKNKAENT
ncbi:hypothetical protein BCIN_09g03690 [Botrytis cinerea B05.10]|uniref:MYND-type domain-containing protein n=1 Tax=Botryotinia fuckeliana (strain B05.10) TaxID=332648 RepID=A0A384JT46_BOTFB|nr:hypothetical protein BCIN_09g03690 [Botrytis cinerea B05.10]ATZ53534.1 hypothetical protein BCIN_09g03690 [Botrytis cinerea B05.10]